MMHTGAILGKKNEATKIIITPISLFANSNRSDEDVVKPSFAKN